MSKNKTKETDKYHYSYDTWHLTVKESGHVYRYRPTHYGISFTPVDFEFQSFHIPTIEARECEDIFEMMADIDAAEIEMRKVFTLSSDGTRLDVHASGNWYDIRKIDNGYAFGINGSLTNELVVRASPEEEKEKGSASLYEYCMYLAEVLDSDIDVNVGADK